MVKKSRPVKSRGRPVSGKALSAAERMRAMRERRKASGLKPVLSWVPAKRSDRSVYSSHRLLEIRSLAMHALIAAKIERDRAPILIAQRNLDRWQARGKEAAPRWLAEWRAILRRPWREVAAFITEMSEDAARLRQSSPFAGALTPLERRRIYDAFRS
jgi:hypothetical protein